MGQREMGPALTSTLIPSHPNFSSWSTEEGDHKAQETDKGCLEEGTVGGGLKKEQNLHRMQRREV